MLDQQHSKPIIIMSTKLLLDVLFEPGGREKIPSNETSRCSVIISHVQGCTTGRRQLGGIVGIMLTLATIKLDSDWISTSFSLFKNSPQLSV